MKTTRRRVEDAIKGNRENRILLGGDFKGRIGERGVLSGNKQGNEEWEWTYIGSRGETVIDYGRVNQEAWEGSSVAAWLSETVLRGRGPGARWWREERHSPDTTARSAGFKSQAGWASHGCCVLWYSCCVVQKKGEERGWAWIAGESTPELRRTTKEKMRNQADRKRRSISGRISSCWMYFLHIVSHSDLVLFDAQNVTNSIAGEVICDKQAPDPGARSSRLSAWFTGF
ncbi:hypothetical protein GEV33_006066 [Tenebrio molitor]|uniref:Uncharacterized protein n=1 Tax=Tenebrio molitor TaxID=7067 RepID=A0A8J6LDH9_TENMO|nr:hypothetical protein GEV33_006066 [Tenebrio molitor]